MLNFSIFMDQLPEKVTMAKSGRTQKDLWLPFWMHSMDTGFVMQYLLKNWVSGSEQRCLRQLMDGSLSREEMYRLGLFLGRIHDVGKITNEFQNMISKGCPELRGRILDAGLPLADQISPQHHSLLGQIILLRGCEEEPGPQSVACVIGAHHGKPSEHADSGVPPHDPSGRWQALQEKWMALILEQCGFDSRENLPVLSQPAQVLWIGLLIMADWIASNEYYFPLLSLEEDGTSIDYDRRVNQAMHRLSLTRPWIPEEAWDAEQLYQERFGFTPNEVQKMVAKAVEETDHPGLYILEAQMGVGKTEAALAAAEAIAAKTLHSGIYFGLPTQATANGIFPRLRTWAEEQSVQEAHSILLAHGGAQLNEDYAALLHGTAETDSDGNDSGILVNEWFSGRKQMLLSDFVIGTVDQLLMAGLKQKHVMLRHLGLANKIVIVDECHAYDAYMNQYLEAVLKWLGAYHVPVLLLSATLPRDRRRDLILAYQNQKHKKGKTEPWMDSLQYPLLTWTEGTRVRQESITLATADRQVKISMPEWETDDYESVAEDLQEKLRNGGCAGVILNTVRRAQACAAVLRKHFKAEEILVLHAQYLMPDRADREKQLLQKLGKKGRRPERLIVVGTQVLEQSLDIDFDYLLTDLCPMDLLLQRIGRLHRHPGRDRPAAVSEPWVQVICAGKELESGAEKIYGAWLLIRTREILREYNAIRLPSDISPLVQKAYDKEWEPPLADSEYRCAATDYANRQKTKKQNAKAYCVAAPEEDEEAPGIYDWLGTTYSDSKANAAVRDGDPSIEVLCLRWGLDEKLYLLGDESFQNPFSPDTMPSEENAKMIAGQRLRLPHIFCLPYRIFKTVESLEQQTQDILKEWRYSGWLRGELFLLFDKNNTAHLEEYQLRYSLQNGLETEKEEL